MASIEPISETAWTVIRGDAMIVPVQYGDVDPADPSAVLPTDITGAVIEMQVRGEYADTDALIELSTVTGEIVITDAAAGEFSIALVPAHTASLDADPTCYVYDVQITQAAAAGPETILRGRFVVLPDVTR